MSDGHAPERYALWQLTLCRMRESLREPGVLFWVFGFPVLLSIGLGLAFRGQGPAPVTVGVIEGPGAPGLEGPLAAAGLTVQRLDEPHARERLRAGKVEVIVIPPAPGAPASAVTYRYDPTRAEARLARGKVDDVLQRAAGRTDPRAVHDQEVVEPGSRYVDFLIPGLLGMNLMSGSMWGIGWIIVNMRVRRLLKRLLATPVRRRDLLIAQILARTASLPLEVATLLVFAGLAFSVHVAGSLLALGFMALLGALSFGGIAILVASRAENTETVSGLMNLVMMPMFLLSGVFFSSSHFPDAMQPLINVLPLTALNDGLRGIMVDGASLAALLRPITVLVVWGLLSFVVGLRIFRWG